MRERSKRQKQAKSRKVHGGVLIAMLVGCWLATAPPGLGQTAIDDKGGNATENHKQDKHPGNPTPKPEEKSGIIVDVPPDKFQGSIDHPTNGTEKPNNTKKTEVDRPDNVIWVWFGDGLAQWFMALLSAAAFVISVYGVILLLSTLRATREIGQKQTSAYISVDRVDIGFFDSLDVEENLSSTLKISIWCLNAGHSPSILNVVKILCRINRGDVSISLNIPVHRISNIPSGKHKVGEIIVDSEDIKTELSKIWGNDETAEISLMVGLGVSGQTVFRTTSALGDEMQLFSEKDGFVFTKNEMIKLDEFFYSVPVEAY